MGVLLGLHSGASAWAQGTQGGEGGLGAQEKHLEQKTSIPSSRATPRSSPKMMATISPPLRTLETAGTRGEEVWGCSGPPGMMEAKRAHAGGVCPPTREMGMGVGEKALGKGPSRDHQLGLPASRR